MARLKDRYIDPTEFDRADTDESKWLLLRQLATNISWRYYGLAAEDVEDMIAEVTLHGYGAWHKWQPEKGNGFRYFTTVLINACNYHLNKRNRYDAQKAKYQAYMRHGN